MNPRTAVGGPRSHVRAMRGRVPAFQEKYGPWALVTGASSGIGAEFARQLSARGLNLVLAARRRELLEQLGHELESTGVVVRVVSLDLSRGDFMSTLLPCIEDLEIGLLVNNAGFGVAGRFLENDLRRELELLDVNCRAPVILTHELGRKMVGRRRGGIVFVSSVVAFLTSPFLSHYSASKGFELLLGEGLHYELQRSGVDVLVLCPGGTDSEFHAVAGVRPMSSMPVEPVVAAGLRALGRKPVTIAGFRNRLMVLGSRWAPRRFVIRIIGSVFERIRQP